MFARRTGWNLKPNRFSSALEHARRTGRALLDLTASNPSNCGFTYEEEVILGALARREALHYEPDPHGLRAAREAVAQYYAALPTSVAVRPEQIFLTTGTSEGYSYAFRLLCEPGDEVLIPHPGYPLFDLLATIQDVKLVPYPLFYDHGWHMDMHALEAAITERTRAIIVVHPNNPTGSFVSAAERKQLAELCAARELALIADEVFLDYGMESAGRSFADNSECLTLTFSGLSKICGLPQMKVAWMVVSGPGELQREAWARLEVIADTYLSMNAPLQVALPELLNTRSSLQKQLRARLRLNLTELDAQLAASPHIQRLAVQAGWYAVLRVPATESDEDLAIRLLEQGVVVHPGHFYEFPSDGYLVVSLMTREADFREGIARVVNSAAR